MQTDLWNYALHLYARPGVAQGVLQLQDAGANVCLVICAAWLGQRGTRCNAQRAQVLRDYAQPWHDRVVRPLRELRQGWRDAALNDPALASVREGVKQLELDAERSLLEHLDTLARDWPAGEAQDTETWLLQVLPVEARRHTALDVLRSVLAEPWGGAGK